MVSLYTYSCTDCQYIYMYIFVKVVISNMYTPVWYIHCCEGFDGELVHILLYRLSVHMYVRICVDCDVNCLHSCIVHTLL